MTTDGRIERLYSCPPMASPRRVTVEEADGSVRSLEHHVHHSPDGHNWGYMGSGPAELAKDILWDYLGHPPAPAMYQDFKAVVVAEVPQTAVFEISGADVQEFLNEWEQDHTATRAI